MKFNLFPKSRKGDITILLLVVLVLLVSSATLFSLVTSSGKVETKILDTRFIENFYMKQDLIKFYINQAGEKAIYKTYNDFAKNGDYINNPIISGGEIEFKDIHNSMDENFNERFTENFKLEFENYNFEEDYLKNLKQIILDKNFVVLINQELVMITINNLEMNNSMKGINITYIPEIALELNLKKIGLHGFNEVYEIKEQCKSVEEVEECYKNLINFKIEISEKEKSDGEKYFLVTLISKKKFLIDGKFDNIVFNFVPM